MSNKCSTDCRFLGSIGCTANCQYLDSNLQGMKRYKILSEVSSGKSKNSIEYTVRSMVQHNYSSLNSNLEKRK